MSKQNTMAMLELAQFKRVLPTIIIDRYQDWEFRQRFQYEALIGLIAEDFLTLKDFHWFMDKTQVNLADSTAWTAVKALSQRNLQIRRDRIVRVQGMGWIGNMLARYKMAGFTKVFTDATSIIRDKIRLPGS